MEESQHKLLGTWSKTILSTTDNYNLSDTMLLSLFLDLSRDKEFDHWMLSDHVAKPTHYDLDFINQL